MSLGTCTGHCHGGVEVLQQWCLGVQTWCQMTLEAPVDNWLACGGVHCVGPLGKLSLDIMEACLGQGSMMEGSCGGVAAAPVAVRGGFSARKIQLFKADDPQGDHLSHPT